MITDILVNLRVGERADTTAGYAVSVAATFGARLTGIAFRYAATAPVSAAGYIPADVIDAQERDNAAAAKAAIDHFVAAGERAGITIESRMVGTGYDGVGSQFGRIARRFDLSIVGQAEPDGGAIEEFIAEAALFESGRPVIVVPYIQKAPITLDRVLVCWDGGRAATRAIADAMPFLRRAGQVEMIIVDKEERGKEDEIEGADMATHLARHGVKVEVNRTDRGDSDVADVILSRAADADCDFMVMGGYGHSRLREFVLGGVTRTLFRSMTMPVLMAH